MSKRLVGFSAAFDEQLNRACRVVKALSARCSLSGEEIGDGDVPLFFIQRFPYVEAVDGTVNFDVCCAKAHYLKSLHWLYELREFDPQTGSRGFPIAVRNPDEARAFGLEWPSDGPNWRESPVIILSRETVGPYLNNEIRRLELAGESKAAKVVKQIRNDLLGTADVAVTDW